MIGVNSFSINWKPLKQKEIEEIIKNKFQFELRREEPYDDDSKADILL